jgi:nuclear pore complex protein Nup188
MNILPQEDQDWDETHPSTSPSDSSQKTTGLTPPTTQSSTPLAESPRRPFTKSISFSSVNGSIVQLPPSNELLSHLDGKTCVIALEFVLTLLASQSLLAQKDIHLSLREKQLIRRELSTELHVFHDFVKKKILKDSTKSILHRKKLGIFKITNDLDDAPDTPRVVKQSAPRKSLEHAKSMRVDVVRKQHLIHQKEKPRNPFEDSMPLSPIPQSKSGEQTPLRGILKPQASTSYKRVGFNLEEQESPFSKVSLREEDEPILLEPIDPSYTGLSLVKLVEEDYLHFLSNLFLVICNTEN